MSNITSALTWRQGYLLHANLPVAPQWFTHTPPTGKPTPPSITSLSAPDQIIMQNWLTKRENGTISSKEFLGVSPSVTALITEFENHFASPVYAQWVNKNLIQREQQWRLMNADVAFEAEAATLAGTLVSAAGTQSGTGVNDTGATTPPAS